MKFIHDTVSLCNHCYRHIPGVIFERDDKIWLTKKCMNHGIMEEVVEVDTEFYIFDYFNYKLCKFGVLS